VCEPECCHQNKKENLKNNSRKKEVSKEKAEKKK